MQGPRAIARIAQLTTQDAISGEVERAAGAAHGALDHLREILGCAVGINTDEVLPGVEDVQRPTFAMPFAHDDRAAVRPGLEPLARHPELHAGEMQTGRLAS